MKSEKKKNIERSATAKEAVDLLDSWLLGCAEDSFERPEIFEGKTRNFKAADFDIGFTVGRFVEIRCGAFCSIFDIEELRIEADRRYYFPVKRLLELMICHPYYWHLLHGAILCELEHATADQRVEILADVDGLPAAQYGEELKKDFAKYRAKQ